MSAAKKPLEATVDNVIGAATLLWDWLGRDPNAPPEKKQEKAQPLARIPPADIVESEGEEVP